METPGTHKRLNFYCQLMIVLLALITIRLWMIPVDMMPRAQAQVMDSGAQRLRIVKAVQQTNDLLADIHDTLKGTLKVSMQGDDNELKTSKPGAKKKRP